jgi:hypothetical protein
LRKIASATDYFFPRLCAGKIAPEGELPLAGVRPIIYFSVISYSKLYNLMEMPPKLAKLGP